MHACLCVYAIVNTCAFGLDLFEAYVSYAELQMTRFSYVVTVFVMNGIMKVTVKLQLHIPLKLSVWPKDLTEYEYVIWESMNDAV